MNDEDLLELFHARSGVVAAVGAGGKKTTLYALISRHPGRAALTATVHMAQFPEHLGLTTMIDEEEYLPRQIARAFGAQKIGFARPSSKPGRHAGVDPAVIAAIHEQCGFDTTFVKADGARRRGIKAPKEGEPVIPPNCSTIIAVVSAQVMGRPLSADTAHRLERIHAVTGLAEGDLVEPEHAARLMTSDQGLLKHTEDRAVVPVINQVDDAGREEQAREAARIAIENTNRFDRVILACMQRTDDPVVDVVTRNDP